MQTLITLLTHERDEDAPNLRLLLAEAWVAVYLAIFSYAFVAYDSRWLYRLMAHPVDEQMFSMVFGGGGEQRTLVETSAVAGGKASVPPRPPSKI